MIDNKLYMNKVSNPRGAGHLFVVRGRSSRPPKPAGQEPAKRAEDGEANAISTSTDMGTGRTAFRPPVQCHTLAKGKAMESNRGPEWHSARVSRCCPPGCLRRPRSIQFSSPCQRQRGVTVYGLNKRYGHGCQS